MNMKLFTSLASAALLVFLLVGTIAYFSAESSELSLAKKGKTPVLQYHQRDERCEKLCKQSGGYVCGFTSWSCCANGDQCEAVWRLRKCHEGKQGFQCQLKK